MDFVSSVYCSGSEQLAQATEWLVNTYGVEYVSSAIVLIVWVLWTAVISFASSLLFLCVKGERSNYLALCLRVDDLRAQTGRNIIELNKKINEIQSTNDWLRLNVEKTNETNARMQAELETIHVYCNKIAGNNAIVEVVIERLKSNQYTIECLLHSQNTSIQNLSELIDSRDEEITIVINGLEQKIIGRGGGPLQRVGDESMIPDNEDPNGSADDYPRAPDEREPSVEIGESEPSIDID